MNNTSCKKAFFNKLGSKHSCDEKSNLITDLIKNIQQRKTLDQAKTQLIFNATHDIRIPLYGIYGLTNYMLGQNDDMDIVEYLKIIDTSARDLLSYCDTILDFSKIELGILPMATEKFNVKKLMTSVIATESSAAKVKNLMLGFEIDNDIVESVIGDIYRMYRLLLNLLNNSIKFTREGKILLKAINMYKEEHIQVIKFSVIDTGIGMPDNIINYINNLSETISEVPNEMYKGLGFGLRTVKSIIKEMNGKMEIISELGKGTILNCIIPFNL
jgi:signal transduction histidine kinase